jgi:hypothetical protein
MLRRLMAVLLVASPSAAAWAQAPETGDWALAQMPNGCMVQAVSPQGTMLSVWGFAGQENIGFLLQNREWSALRDGQRYDLRVEFTGQRAWPVSATARRNIDSDGPGYYFDMAPGGAAADGFLEAFATAKGMNISQDGHKVDSLPLAGSREAMATLARCLSDHWAEPAPGETAEPAEPEAVETTV